MVNGFERRKENGPEAKKVELLRLAEAEGYNLESVDVDGNIIRFTVIDNEQGLVGIEAAKLFCKQYNLLHRRSDDSQAIAREDGQNAFVELNASRH